MSGLGLYMPATERTMEQEKIVAFLEENIKTIYAYALSRISKKEDAEELAGDIMVAILQDGHRVQF